MKNRKATMIESTLLITTAILGGWYVGSMVNNNISQEPEIEPIRKLLIIEHVQSTSPILEV